MSSPNYHHQWDLLLINAEAMSKSKTKNNLHVTFLLPLLEVSQGVCVCWFLYPLNHLEIFEMMTVRRMTRGLAAG